MEPESERGRKASPFGLDDSERKFRSIMDSVPSGIVVTDDAGTIVLCNTETERLFGYEHGELLGQRVEVLVPARLRRQHPSFRGNFIQDPSKRQMGAGRDLTGVRKNGSEFPVEIGLNHVRSGGKVFVIAAIVDITERKKQEERFRTIVESVPNGIIMADASGAIVECNSEAERLFGYDRGELLGKPVETLVPTRYHGEHPRYRSRFAEQPQKRQMGAGRDLAGRRKDGTEVPVEIGLNPIDTPQGRYVLASIVDISERKAVDDKLHRAYTELQQKNQEMEQFVYTVSHDLKAPLVTSMSFIGFLKEDIAEKNFTDVADSLERLERAHRRMQQLINDLLELSRIGRMDLQLELTPLAEVLAEVRENFAERVANAGCELVVAPHLPAIRGDRRRLHQVFENLVGNALKYSCLPGQRSRVEVFWEEDERETRICVQDNGPGIDPQYHQKIFGLFQRLDSSKEGTGVGLTIVSRVMQLHGGRVWVDSQLGQGARFWTAFPKRREGVVL